MAATLNGDGYDEEFLLNDLVKGLMTCLVICLMTLLLCIIMPATTAGLELDIDCVTMSGNCKDGRW
jgi:hypothetical protein